MGDLFLIWCHVTTDLQKDGIIYLLANALMILRSSNIIKATSIIYLNDHPSFQDAFSVGINFSTINNQRDTSKQDKYRGEYRRDIVGGVIIPFKLATRRISTPNMLTWLRLKMLLMWRTLKKMQKVSNARSAIWSNLFLQSSICLAITTFVATV